VPFIESVPLLIASQGLVGLGRGIFFPVLMALSIQGVSSSERATAMGVFQSLYAIGMLVGPLALGFLADGMGLDSVFYLSVVLCILGGMLSFAPGILRLRAQPPGS
jgi:MFS family permease